MNVRCYRCGWSITLSREAVEAAAVSSAGQKAHVIHCPRCRQAIRIPMDQIMRALPAGWTAPEAAEPAGPAAEAASAGAAQAAPEPAPAEPAEEQPRQAGRRHRHASKANPVDSAALPAAKQDTHH